MIYLFSKKGLRDFKKFVSGRPLLAFDYDGTLAPIALDPEKADIRASTRLLLERINSLSPVAVVSGRALVDLKRRVGHGATYYIGNHGIEGEGASRSLLAEHRRTCRTWIQQWRSLKLQDGVRLEDKKYSLALHYRAVRREGIRKRLLSRLENLRPRPQLVYGKQVLNLLPQDAPTKGVTLMDLMKRHSLFNAIYVGDDDTDESVFSLSGQKFFSIRVGKKERSEARYYLRRQEEISSFLRMLLKSYHRSTRRKHMDILQ